MMDRRRVVAGATALLAWAVGPRAWSQARVRRVVLLTVFPRADVEDRKSVV